MPRTQQSLFQWMVSRHVDTLHPLMGTGREDQLDGERPSLGSVLPPGKGRQTKTIRLMVGLMILKHEFDIFGERVE